MTEALPAPPRTLTGDDNERRVGFEIEFAGVEPQYVVALIESAYGGASERLTEFEYVVRDTRLGDFRFELDAEYLKRVAQEVADEEGDSERGDWPTDLLAAAAQWFVPWEIVTDPIPLSRLEQLESLSGALRGAGALGTGHSIRYAFGTHLNPELPRLSAETILAYLRAYLCLYDWLCERETVDASRKITPYIDAFPKPYVSRVIHRLYRPGMSQLIDEYLEFNPTRNRSLDMLPVFAHIDAERVRAAVDDPRIKPRPALHYRLPNSDIDRPDWSLLVPWRDWLQVEFLAADPPRLRDMCVAFAADLERFTRRLDARWAQESEKWLIDLTSA